MDVCIDDMKQCVQEWFAQAMDFETLFDIYYAVKSETEEQAIYMAQCISDERRRADNG